MENVGSKKEEKKKKEKERKEKEYKKEILAKRKDINAIWGAIKGKLGGVANNYENIKKVINKIIEISIFKNLTTKLFLKIMEK